MKTWVSALWRSKRIFSIVLWFNLVRSYRSQIFCLRGWCWVARHLFIVQLSRISRKISFSPPLFFSPSANSVILKIIINSKINKFCLKNHSHFLNKFISSTNSKLLSLYHYFSCLKSEKKKNRKFFIVKRFLSG